MRISRLVKNRCAFYFIFIKFKFVHVNKINNITILIFQFKYRLFYLSYLRKNTNLPVKIGFFNGKTLKNAYLFFKSLELIMYNTRCKQWGKNPDPDFPKCPLSAFCIFHFSLIFPFSSFEFSFPIFSASPHHRYPWFDFVLSFLSSFFYQETNHSFLRVVYQRCHNISNELQDQLITGTMNHWPRTKLFTKPKKQVIRPPNKLRNWLSGQHKSKFKKKKKESKNIEVW